MGRPGLASRVNEDTLEADLQGVCMAEQGDRPRALFYSGVGRPLLPDHLVCSGRAASSLHGKPCLHSIGGRMPDPVVIRQEMSELGEVGDRAPPCSVRHYGSLAGWLGPQATGFPGDVLGLRLFECKQMFLLVIPGVPDERDVTGSSSAGG